MLCRRRLNEEHAAGGLPSRLSSGIRLALLPNNDLLDLFRFYEIPSGLRLPMVRTIRKAGTFSNDDFVSATHVRVDAELLVDVPGLWHDCHFRHVPLPFDAALSMLCRIDLCVRYITHVRKTTGNFNSGPAVLPCPQ